MILFPIRKVWGPVSFFQVSSGRLVSRVSKGGHIKISNIQKFLQNPTMCRHLCATFKIAIYICDFSMTSKCWSRCPKMFSLFRVEKEINVEPLLILSPGFRCQFRWWIVWVSERCLLRLCLRRCAGHRAAPRKRRALPTRRPQPKVARATTAAVKTNPLRPTSLRPSRQLAAVIAAAAWTEAMATMTTTTREWLWKTCWETLRLGQSTSKSLLIR